MVSGVSYLSFLSLVCFVFLSSVAALVFDAPSPYHVPLYLISVTGIE